MVRAASRVFLAVWFLAFAAPAVFAGNRVALVIGNSDYALASLENPKSDADDVAAVLKLHFTVTTRKNLIVREFDQVIDSFEATAKDAEVAFFSQIMVDVLNETHGKQQAERLSRLLKEATARRSVPPQGRTIHNLTRRTHAAR